MRQKGFVKAGAADDENLVGSGAGGGQIGEVSKNRDAFCGGKGGAEHDVLSARQRSADGLEGGAAHEDGVSEGSALEEFEVFREVPGQGAIPSDHPVG